MIDLFHEVAPFLELLIVPVFVWVVKIERQLARQSDIPARVVRLENLALKRH